MAVPLISLLLERLTSLNIPRSEILAIWGALTGTTALGWNILRHLHSKGRLKLEWIYRLE